MRQTPFTAAPVIDPGRGPLLGEVGGGMEVAEKIGPPSEA